MTFSRFQKLVWQHYKKHGRHTLPWRKTRNLYHILVSEVMLQQTQVERVIAFYARFIQQFSSAKKLAHAPLSQVLKVWQGLGYNRRAKMLREAAKKLASSNLKTITELEALPGVGPYTARAIAAFAWNRDVVFVETNIRTALIHHFFPRRESVADTELVEVLQRLLPKGKAREWYSALMDYGASLKRSGISRNARSLHYAKQSKFSGSVREARGAIVRRLASHPASHRLLTNLLGSTRRTQLEEALLALLKEGFIKKKKGVYTLAR